jgi:hypothetical protein
MMNDAMPAALVALKRLGVGLALSGAIVFAGGSSAFAQLSTTTSAANRAPATTTTYSLDGNWSDSENPNGTWTYRQGASSLPSVPAFDFAGTVGMTPQPAWAPSNKTGDFLPAWFKVRSALTGFDWQIGDVVVHTTDGSNGANSGVANVTWVSPGAGTVTISGGLWEVRDIGRSNQWEVTHDGTSVAKGELLSGDGHGRSNPETFSKSALAVKSGDVLQMTVTKLSNFGDIVGIKWSIQFTPTPPPECTLEDSVSYNDSAGILTMKFTLESEVATTWNVWLTDQNAMTLLSSEAQKVTYPPATITKTHDLAKEGIVGILATLTTPTRGIICSSWALVNTGVP